MFKLHETFTDWHLPAAPKAIEAAPKAQDERKTDQKATKTRDERYTKGVTRIVGVSSFTDQRDTYNNMTKQDPDPARYSASPAKTRDERPYSRGVTRTFSLPPFDDQRETNMTLQDSDRYSTTSSRKSSISRKSIMSRLSMKSRKSRNKSKTPDTDFDKLKSPPCDHCDHCNQ